MEVLAFRPCLALNPYVFKIIYLRNNLEKDLASAMIPRGYPAFIFTFPDQLNIENSLGNDKRIYKPCSILFNGIVTESAYSLFPSKSSFIVCLLYPHSTGQFFQEDASYFVNTVIDITTIDQLHRDTIEKIASANTLAGKIAAVESYLLARVRSIRLCSIVGRAMALIPSVPSNYPIHQLARHSFASERNLRRKFTQHVGISAKQYASILRFREMVKQVIKEKEVNWSQVVTDFGYYDFSHIAKDFKKFTGFTPHEYVSQYHSIDVKMLPSL